MGAILRFGGDRRFTTLRLARRRSPELCPPKASLCPAPFAPRVTPQRRSRVLRRSGRRGTELEGLGLPRWRALPELVRAAYLLV